MGAKRVRNHPNVERLNELFTYDPYQGTVTRKIDAGNYKAGDVVGSFSGPYGITTVDGVALLLHRVAWALNCGEWPSLQVDHINGNKRDNRAENLREATHSENMRNKAGWGKSRIKGVCWVKKDKRWRASLGIGKSVRYLGQYDRICDAIHAHRKAAQAVQGEFALHNRASVMQHTSHNDVSQTPNHVE